MIDYSLKKKQALYLTKGALYSKYFVLYDTGGK